LSGLRYALFFKVARPSAGGATLTAVLGLGGLRFLARSGRCSRGYTLTLKKVLSPFGDRFADRFDTPGTASTASAGLVRPLRRWRGFGLCGQGFGGATSRFVAA
jgi:hypothetical protein